MKLLLLCLATTLATARVMETVKTQSSSSSSAAQSAQQAASSSSRKITQKGGVEISTSKSASSQASQSSQVIPKTSAITTTYKNLQQNAQQSSHTVVQKGDVGTIDVRTSNSSSNQSQASQQEVASTSTAVEQSSRNSSQTSIQEGCVGKSSDLARSQSAQSIEVGFSNPEQRRISNSKTGSQSSDQKNAGGTSSGRESGSGNSQSSWQSQKPEITPGPESRDIMINKTVPIVVHPMRCPDGWTTTSRARGPWCHKVFGTSLTWDDAEKACEKEGAHLSGLETDDEFNTVLAVVTSTLKNTQVSLGGRRKLVCDKPGYVSYKSDVNHECSRKNVFEWWFESSHNADMINKHWSSASPDYANGQESSLTWLIGRPYPNPYPYKTGDFNDSPRWLKKPYLCGKAANVKSL